jgi:hypothetical protein
MRAAVVGGCLVAILGFGRRRLFAQQRGCLDPNAANLLVRRLMLLDPRKGFRIPPGALLPSNGGRGAGLPSTIKCGYGALRMSKVRETSYRVYYMPSTLITSWRNLRDRQHVTNFAFLADTCDNYLSSIVREICAVDFCGNDEERRPFGSKCHSARQAGHTSTSNRHRHAEPAPRRNSSGSSATFAGGARRTWA